MHDSNKQNKYQLLAFPPISVSNKRNKHSLSADLTLATDKCGHAQATELSDPRKQTCTTHTSAASSVSKQTNKTHSCFTAACTKADFTVE